MARDLKAKPENFRQRLSGQTLGMLFSKSSTRTRVSFEAGMIQLGGHALFLPATSSQFGRGELLRDTARFPRYLDLIMVRTHSHEELRELAEHSNVPVINALTSSTTLARRWQTRRPSKSNAVRFLDRPLLT